MFDIGETVKQGVARAERGVSFVTVHGDRESTKAAVEPLKILAIMVLPSIDADGPRDLGFLRSVDDLIQLRVKRSIGQRRNRRRPAGQSREIRQRAGSESLLIATTVSGCPTPRQTSTSALLGWTRRRPPGAKSGNPALAPGQTIRYAPRRMTGAGLSVAGLSAAVLASCTTSGESTP